MTEENKIIGGFRVLRDLKAGAGSQGTVYKAVCERPCFPTLSVGDVVALKVMAVQDDDGEAFARLEKRTAELVGLRHLGVVRYHGCFREQGPFNDIHVIVLEYVEGKSLKTIMDESPCGLGTEEAMRIAVSLVTALDYTSSRGIVHRDIKPGNIIVMPDGAPKLIDFEVARREGGTMTIGGSNMIGTFDYMAPDFTSAEFRGDVISDVFSMGVVLHEMLTGRTPYRRHSGTSSQANVAFLQRWMSVGSASNPLRVSSRVGKLLVGMRDVLEQALAPDRAKRYRDFKSLGEALANVRYREIAHAGRVWRFLKYIGHGGFGEVFAAVDRKTGERVAVKHLINASGIDRFRREASAMRKVSDSCFTRYVDYFTADGGAAFLVMDFLDGMPGASLKDVISQSTGRRLERSAVLTAFSRYAHGLADLHALGLIHRDIKPANLYFPAADPVRAVVMDLGIARDVSGTATVGQVPGTIDYMPPECVTGKTRGGPEADVWALGLCLYEAMTGRTSYPRLPDGVAAYEAYFKRVRDNVQPDFSGLFDDPALCGLLREMCAINPGKRLVDMRQIERRLRILNGEKPELLPEPSSGFIWHLAEDADFADAADAESESGVTMATVCGNEMMLSRMWENFSRRSEPSGRGRRAVVATMIVIVMVVGGVFAWRFAEKQRLEALAEASHRAQVAAEEARMRENALQRERAEAERKAEEELRKAEADREKAEKERIAREKIEAERLKLERAAAEAERREQMRKEETRKMNARIAEEARKAEELRRKAQQEAEKEKAARMRRERDEAEQKEKAAREMAEKEKLARKAAEERRMREAQEREKRAREERDRAEREAKDSRERQSQIDKLDVAFQNYTRQYQTKLDEALKPGSRIDPVKLQQEWLIKKHAYQKARKKLEK